MTSPSSSASSASLNIFSVGASRNIGYYSSIKLLDLGATVTFLLRHPEIFDNDETIQKYVKAGKARLVKGDALVRSDVQNAWDVASKNSKVDVLLFTLGGQPSGFSITQGFLINPVNLVTQSLLNVLSTMPQNTYSHIRVIAISSTGMTKASHAALPFLFRILYPYLLKVPHKDKLGMERALAHCAGWTWNPEEDGGDPGNDIMGEDWKQREGLPGPGELKRVLVLRPAFFTDGPSVADQRAQQGDANTSTAKPPYRASEAELGGWTISRKDVAHFVVEAIWNKWEEFEGKRVNIAY